MLEMTSSDETVEGPLATEEVGAVLFVDLVESVRLNRVYGADAIHRWLAFEREVRGRIVPVHGGRLVKSGGDGFIAIFKVVDHAIAAAFGMQMTLRRQTAADEARLRLRCGVNWCTYFDGGFDVFGAGVDLTHRLTTVALPDEVMISTEAKARLAPGGPIIVEPIGPRKLRHIEEMVEIFRVAPKGVTPPERPKLRFETLLPTIGVSRLEETGGAEGLGDRLADDLRRSLARTIGLSVSSRLGPETLGEDPKRPKVPFVVTGSVNVEDGIAEVFLELADTRRRALIWQDRFSVPVEQLSSVDGRVMAVVGAEISLHIVEAEREVARGRADNALESHTLLISAVSLMNSLAQPAFDRARDAFETLIETSGRHPTPLAWTTIWYVLRRLQGWTADIEDDRAIVEDLLARAFDAAPNDYLVLTAHGLARAHLYGDGPGARAAFDRALSEAPDEPLALAARSITLATIGQGEAAVNSALRAATLSPLDPQLFFFQGSQAFAFLSAGDAKSALDVAYASRMNNARYVPGAIAKAVAEVWAGDPEIGKAEMAALVLDHPEITIEGFLACLPDGAGDLGEGMADTLFALGLPSVL